MTKQYITIFVLLLLGIGIWFVSGKRGDIKTVNPLGKSESQLATPTPFPFQEMTIPFLRNRMYASTLGPQTVYSQTSTYTSYLTSYISDGLKINALVTVPKNEDSKHPAIVFVHGYIPPKEYTTTGKYVDYVDYLARNGFVVLKIDLRGHGSSEGEPGGGYYSGDYVIDTLNARAALQASSFVDPNKIGLWGHSMAGNVVMRAFAAAPEIPAVAIWAGAGYTYQDLQEYRISDASYRPPSPSSTIPTRRRELFDKYGQFTGDSWFWKQVVPTNYLSDLKGAIELHHATDDNVVSIKYSQNLVRLLDNTQVPHALFEYQSGGHNISGGNFVTAMQRTVEFFQKYL